MLTSLQVNQSLTDGVVGTVDVVCIIYGCNYVPYNLCDSSTYGIIGDQSAICLRHLRMPIRKV